MIMPLGEEREKKLLVLVFAVHNAKWRSQGAGEDKRHQQNSVAINFVGLEISTFITRLFAVAEAPLFLLR
jgi:hypothetical protein